MGSDSGDPPDPSSDAAGLNRRKLFFHDGATGLRQSSIQLQFKPNHPEWSPDGTMIAVTRVGNEATTTQKPTRGSIELLRRQGTTWSAPVGIVPQASMFNRYNPNFVPDSSFFFFSESACPGGNWDHEECDADADRNAKTWAVRPQAGATPILLARASSPGVGDGVATQVGDTFPRSAPFQTVHRSGKLFWFTVARRSIGLRDRDVDEVALLLWMFAVDPAKVLAGEDGSYPGFFLPFQDLATSNHIAQWTQRIVGGSQPPPTPVPPRPPAPPPPSVPK